MKKTTRALGTGLRGRRQVNDILTARLGGTPVDSAVPAPSRASAVERTTTRRRIASTSSSGGAPKSPVSPICLQNSGRLTDSDETSRRQTLSTQVPVRQSKT